MTYDGTILVLHVVGLDLQITIISIKLYRANYTWSCTFQILCFTMCMDKLDIPLKDPWSLVNTYGSFVLVPGSSLGYNNN